MQTMSSVLRRAAVSGSSASLASTAALLHGGAKDCSAALAPVNAVSHWIWKGKALRQRKASLRYSATGYAIHHLASIFWALCYERMAGPRGANAGPGRAVAVAGAVAFTACVADLCCIPERLTPGFERRLGRGALGLVYSAFGAGLAMHSLLFRADGAGGRRRQR